MSDSYIDQYETQAYGPFAVSQIEELVLPLDADFKKPLAAVARRLAAATEAMGAAMRKAGALEATTFKSGASAGAHADPLAAGRDVMRRLVKYAESRPSGSALAAKILQNQTLTTVLRRRPAKLVGSMTHALGVIEQHKRELPEHKAWAADLKAVRDALDALTKSVRKTRLARRAMTPEVRAARAEWLKVYGAAKLLVECVLRLHDKVHLMPEVFDDLAEVHRVAGVTDSAAEADADPEEAPQGALSPS